MIPRLTKGVFLESIWNSNKISNDHPTNCGHIVCDTPMNPAHRRNLCQSFVNYLRDHPKGTLRIDFPDTWLSNAITSSGGAGNPAGSVITLDAQAVEPVRRSMLEGICRLASEATVSQAIFDSTSSIRVRTRLVETIELDQAKHFTHRWR